MNHKPVKITVATVTYNAVGVLQRTLDSVAAQNYAHVEHLIIDGNSHDGTLALFQHFQKLLPYRLFHKQAFRVLRKEGQVVAEQLAVLVFSNRLPINQHLAPVWLAGIADRFQ